MQQHMFEDKLDKDPSIAEVLLFYQRSLQASRKSKNTVRNYAGTIERMGTFLHNPKMSEVRTFGLERLLAQMRKEGMDEKTIEVTVSALRHFFRWAVEREIVASNAAERIVFPSVGLKLPDIPTKAEFEAMLKCCGPRPRDYLLILLFGVGGLKREELLGLKWEDFDRSDPFRVDVVIRSGDAKKIRKRKMPAETGTAMDAYTKERKEKGWPSSDSVFPFNRTHLSEVIGAIGREAKAKKPVTPQSLRHYAAVTMLRAGMTLKEVHEALGLADPKFSAQTAQMYDHLARVAK